MNDNDRQRYPKPTPHDELRARFGEEVDRMQIVSRCDLAGLVRKSVPTVDRWRKEGRLPPPVRFPSGAVGWRLSTIRRWLAGLQGEGQ